MSRVARPIANQSFSGVSFCVTHTELAGSYVFRSTFVEELLGGL